MFPSEPYPGYAHSVDTGGKVLIDFCLPSCLKFVVSVESHRRCQEPCSKLSSVRATVVQPVYFVLSFAANCVWLSCCSADGPSDATIYPEKDIAYVDEVSGHRRGSQGYPTGYSYNDAGRY